MTFDSACLLNATTPTLLPISFPGQASVPFEVTPLAWRKVAA